MVGEGVGAEISLAFWQLHCLQISALVQMEIGTLSTSGNEVEQLSAHAGGLNNGAFLRSVSLFTHL